MAQDPTHSTLYRSSESLSDLWTPEDVSSANLPAINDLGQLLCEHGAIDATQLSTARAVLAKTPGKSLPDILYDMGVEETELQRVVAHTAEMAFEQIDAQGIEAVKHVERLGIDFCAHHGILPLRQSGSRLLVGVTHPDNLLIIDEVRHKLGMSIKPVVVCRNDIAAYIERYKEENSHQKELGVDEIIGDIDEEDCPFS